VKKVRYAISVHDCSFLIISFVFINLDITMDKVNRRERREINPRRCQSYIENEAKRND